MRDNCKDCWNIVPNGHDRCKYCIILNNSDFGQLSYKEDWDKIFCHGSDFINLQESIAWFGNSEDEAREDYAINLRKK